MITKDKQMITKDYEGLRMITKDYEGLRMITNDYEGYTNDYEG